MFAQLCRRIKEEAARCPAAWRFRAETYHLHSRGNTGSREDDSDLNDPILLHHMHIALAFISSHLMVPGYKNPNHFSYLLLLKSSAADGNAAFGFLLVKHQQLDSLGI